MKRTWDVIVIGAGPSGLACAAAAAEEGLETLLLDEQPAPGGQIYRNIEAQSEETLNHLGDDYRHGLGLVKRFRSSSATYLPESVVWNLEHDGRVSFSRDKHSIEVRGTRVVIATGAMERPAPFSGWTLPGVTGAGAIDSFFKRDGLLPDGPVTLAGSGPIMLLVANHLLQFGIEVNAFFDTTLPLPGAIFSALPEFPRAAARLGYLLKGVGMLQKTKSGVGQYHKGIVRCRAEGDGRVERVTATARNGRTWTVETGNLLAHEGIIPRTEFSRQLRLEHSWDAVQRCWYPQVDSTFRTSSPKIYMVGDGTFVHGALSAEMKGEIAALAIVSELRGTDTGAKSSTLQRSLAHELLPRPFVDKLYTPRPELFQLEDDVMVCRCEEITAGQIRRAVADGSPTPGQVKSFTRSGMGPCQGRMCNTTLAEVVAAETGVPVESLALPTVRPPVRNIGMSELATMELLEPENDAEEAKQ